MSYKKFANDIAFSVAANLVGAVSGIIILPLIARFLGPEEYGVWTQLFVTMALLSTVALLGLPYTLVRFLAGEKDSREIQDGVWSVATVIFGISLSIAITLFFLAPAISRFFHCPPVLVELLAIIIIFEYPNQVFYNVFRAFQQNITYYLFFTIPRLGEVALIILAVQGGYGLLGALLAVLAIKIATCAVMVLLILRQIGFAFPKFSSIGQYLRFSLPTIPDYFAWWVINSSDRYLIGAYLGTLFVGYYASAYNISTFALNFLVSPFSFLLPAILSKFYDQNKFDDAKIYLTYSLKYFLILAIPATMGLSVLSLPILTMLTTPESAKQAMWVIPIVALGMLAMGTNAIIAQIMGITKKTKASAAIAGIAAAVNVALNIILIPRFGIAGAAVATLVAITLLAVLTWIYSFKHFTFPIDWISMIKSLIASGIMGTAVFLLHPRGLYQILGSIAVGGLIYGGLVLAMKIFSQKEIRLLRQVLKKV